MYTKRVFGAVSVARLGAVERMAVFIANQMREKALLRLEPDRKLKRLANSSFAFLIACPLAF